MSQSINDEQILAVAGVRWASTSAGIKPAGNLDLAIMALDAGTTLSAVFTQNAFSAAPVKLAQKHLSYIQSLGDKPLFCLINSGNANAGTGPQGDLAAQRSCQSLAEVADCDERQILPFSTGVIGEPLAVEPFVNSMPALWQDLTAQGWSRASQAMMTTDTVPKGMSRTIDVDGKRVTISGICKGAGMIRPNMATMLAFVATDASIGQPELDELLGLAVRESFNRITVDGDTSTNDACLLAATGVSGVAISKGSHSWQAFQVALKGLFVDMATAIIRDAEGASKFVTIDVVNGMRSDECLQVAYTVAESPLVKTAFFASDANWGRILAAVGRAGVADLDVDAVAIYLDDLLICEHGGRAAGYSEEAAMAIMSQSDIAITINLNRGDTRERIWTSDLSLDYVRINAEYRT